MTGVEILSSQPIYNTYLPGWCTGLALLAFLLCSVIGLTLTSDRYIIVGTTLAVIGDLLCIVLLVLSLSVNKASIAYWEHKVIIDDSVSMTEFMEKYEPIEQDGKIWIVKEKN